MTDQPTHDEIDALAQEIEATLAEGRDTLDAVDFDPKYRRMQEAQVKGGGLLDA